MMLCLEFGDEDEDDEDEDDEDDEEARPLRCKNVQTP
jgi:hypothetical protein